MSVQVIKNVSASPSLLIVRRVFKLINEPMSDRLCRSSFDLKGREAASSINIPAGCPVDDVSQII